MQDQAVTYMRIRLFGAPAMLAMLTAFGALRGLQDMRSPLWIALAVNALNILLDALVILGFGPIPGLGIAGAAAASAFAQTAGRRVGGGDRPAQAGLDPGFQLRARRGIAADWRRLISPHRAVNGLPAPGDAGGHTGGRGSGRGAPGHPPVLDFRRPGAGCPGDHGAVAGGLSLSDLSGWPRRGAWLDTAASGAAL